MATAGDAIGTGRLASSGQGVETFCHAHRWFIYAHIRTHNHTHTHTNMQLLFDSLHPYQLLTVLLLK